MTNNRLHTQAEASTDTPTLPVPLPQVTDYANGISAIDAGYLRTGLAAIHLIVEAGKAALVDTGTSSSVAGLMEILHKKNVAPADVAYVFLTHIHLDHAGGAGEFMHRFPNAKLVVHPRGARHMADPARLVASATEVYGEAEFKRVYGVIRPVEANRIIEAPDGFSLDFNGRPLLFLDTPGHARHHYSIFDKQSQSFFTGDTFGIVYPDLHTPRGPYIVPATAPVHFDPTALHETVARLLAQRPEVMYLTHYGAVHDAETLAVQFLAQVDAMADAARALADAPDRHDALKRAFGDIYIAELLRSGSTQSENWLRELLAIDIELNAQGLGTWLDRH